MGQEHTVKVPLPSGQITAEVIPDINERFHMLHEQTYSFRLETPVELVNYHLIIVGHVKQPEIRKLDEGMGDLNSAQKETRRVNFDEFGFHKTAIYERDLLPVRVSLRGPVVIEEPASTTVVFPDQQLTRDEYGFLHIEAVD
jgi:N-methylhydantoinase A